MAEVKEEDESDDEYTKTAKLCTKFVNSYNQLNFISHNQKIISLDSSSYLADLSKIVNLHQKSVNLDAEYKEECLSLRVKL